MKLKKFLILLIILFILINISCINATENNTNELEINNKNPINIDENIPNNELNQTDNEMLGESINDENSIQLQNNMDNDKLSTFEPVLTQITISVNDTEKLETTGNITINMQFSFRAIQHNGEFTSQNINIYENNTLIKILNIGEQNLPELGIITSYGAGSSIDYKANVLFDYTVHDNSYLTTSLFGVYSNILQFEKIKNIEQYTLNSTNILINNQTIISNNTWLNNINSIKKAVELINNNETLQLSNINIIQDDETTILLDKNITLTGNNSTFTLQNKGLLFKITPKTCVTFINLTFMGNNPDIFYNEGKVKFINCTFRENNLGLITNAGELEIENCQIKEINQIYLDRSTSNQNGLIKNSGILKIKNTLFTNNDNDLLPNSLAILPETLKAIIYNNGILTIDNSTFKNLKDRIIYNEGNFTLTRTIMDNINTLSTTVIYKTSTQQPLNNQYTYNTYKIYSENKLINGGAIYNNNQSIIINSTFKSITGNIGGAIYNTNKLNIENTLFDNVKSKSTGSIYNIGTLNINNTQIQNNNGGAIYNTGTLNINNTQINKTSTSAIYNNGTSNINNTIITECRGIGAGVYNDNILQLVNCQILNNYGLVDTKWRYENNGAYAYVDRVYSGVIYNGENANANITKSIIKNNIVNSETNNNWQTYYGNIKNDGILKISGCIFDNNTPNWKWFGGDGSFNIYNTGKITVMYCYLLNTKIYVGSNTGSGVHSPHSFLYNTGKGTCNINYNFYCLNPSSIIANANPNYYFIPAFEDEYYPIKLNENKNITLTLGLTNGVDKIDFNDWDKLLTPGLNATITTINENGEYINITTLLKDKYTFNFNYTNNKTSYIIYANILNYKNTAIVDTGKEFPEMTITYNNITYTDGNNITFHIKVTGNLTVQPTGNITFTYNNKKITLNITNGECNYTITEKLKPANYTMRIDYNGDDEYFKIIKQYCPFTVHKIRTNVTLSAPEIKIGETGKLTITITPGDVKLYGYLYYTTDRLHEANADTKGTRTLTLKNFPVGIHNLTVIFEEDEYYTGGTFTTFFTVSKYETQLNLTSKNYKVGENAILNLTIQPGDVRGEAILTINGENRTIFINNTVTPITITNLENGIYHVSVYYPGDKKYAPSNATTSFTVSRKTTNLTVNITNNDDLTGNILVKTDYTDCTGEVGVYINNDPVLIMNLTDGYCNFPVKFKRGTNYIYILYLGDNVYSHVSWNTTSIIEGRAIINTTDNVFNEQEPGTYIISLFDTDGNPYEYTNITVVFKNQTITLTTDENGTAKLPIQSRAGEYNITVSYKNNTYSDIITVNPARIIIDIKDILAGEVEVITATLPDGASGNITLIVDNTIINQSSTLTIPNLSVGEHNLTVIYSGDDNYITQTIQTRFSIKNAISSITISSSNITYGEEVSVTGWVTAGATGTVTLTLYNQTQTVNLTGNQAKAIFKNIPAGNYIITARYNGDSIYQGSGDTIQVNVKKASPTITVKTTPLVLNTNIQIDALLNDDATGNVTFRIQGQYSPRNRTIVNGNASWLISPLNTGSYNLIVTYNGDNNYESGTVSEILVLNQVRTVLKVSIGDVNEDDDLIVTATLTDINNQKLSGDLVLEIGGKYYRIIITNGEGSRNLGEFKAGKYDFTATYTGTDLLSMSNSAGTFNVIANNYKITGNKNIVQYYGANKEYKVQVLNNNVPVKNAIVSIKINKNTVNVKTDTQGYATLKLTLKPGKYTITSTYKNVKVTNKITVKKTLITKNKKIKKGKTLTYTAKLLNKNGKKLKNKKITFKINGKKYKAKTNKKGIAKIKVKNLKKGKYKIKTSYGKIKNTNTITVK